MPYIPKTNSLKKKAPKKSVHDKVRWSADGENRYNTTRWRKNRRTFLKYNPACVDCKGRGVFTPATVVDHVIPVSQGADFWEQSNWQALCQSCHNSKTGKEGQAKSRR
jgi:5-methylcytosine-specific restriction protein A